MLPLLWRYAIPGRHSNRGRGPSSFPSVALASKIDWAETLTQELPAKGNWYGAAPVPIQSARKSGFTRIEGNLFPLDLGKNPRLPDWYRRHGFEVGVDPEFESGKVRLDLTMTDKHSYILLFAIGHISVSTAAADNRWRQRGRPRTAR